MGGFIFRNVNSIERELIDSTVESFREELKKRLYNFDLLENYFYLGSTGKKDVSGDIDLGIPTSTLDKFIDPTGKVDEIYTNLKARARTSTDAELMRKAKFMVMYDLILQANYDHQDRLIDCAKHRINPTDIHFSVPVAGHPGRYVQVDIITGVPEWLKYMYHSNEDRGLDTKGLHRTQLLLSLYRIFGVNVSHAKGIKLKGEKVYTVPSVSAFLGMMPYTLTEEDTRTFKNLYNWITTNLDEPVRLAIFDDYLKTLDKTPRVGVPIELQEYRNLNKLQLKLLAE